jgi:pyoverdine/dityrosine biosynthesis protein Dit1
MEVAKKSIDSKQTTDETVNRIITEVFANRRLLPGEEAKSIEFNAETAPHLDKIKRAVDAQQPIKMVLPAFPAKSPSRRKTLSHLPDFGEEMGLANLNDMCNRIAQFYEHGAKVKVCSDGRVFADVVRIPDHHVTAYNKALRELAKDMKLHNIEFFDLDDVYPSMTDYPALREDLMVLYGEALNSLRKRCRSQREAGEMYRGITKFLLEDFSGLEEFNDLSRNSVQGLARTAAYRVIQRSNAWSRLLADRFPNALRLSIHPQSRVSEKIGINLIGAHDCWATPWHTVVLKRGNQVSLVSRAEAEAQNAVLIFKNGLPSYFQLWDMKTADADRGVSC